MRENWIPDNPQDLSEYFKTLRQNRESLKKQNQAYNRRRKSLTKADRDLVLKKTDGRCHICGGLIEGAWQADHVLAHAAGGGHSVDNYLPSHKTCNNYRWNYHPDEFQEILRLGVWLRTQIEKQNKFGQSAGEAFIKYEKSRIARRKHPNPNMNSANHIVRNQKRDLAAMVLNKNVSIKKYGTAR